MTSLPAYSITRTPEGTQVCGEISADAVWAAATGVYIVTCDVHVRAGVTLTLEPGITVRFQHANDDLIISGLLQAVGADAAPIAFRPVAATEPGRWSRVAFLAGSASLYNRSGSAFHQSHTAANAWPVMPACSCAGDALSLHER